MVIEKLLDLLITNDDHRKNGKIFYSALVRFLGLSVGFNQFVYLTSFERE